MRALPRLLLAGLVAWLAGCAPSIQDGWFRCETGPCPRARPFCWDDFTCHSLPETPSRDGGTDSGTPPTDDGGTDPYPPCGAAGACAGGSVCIADDVTRGGYCAPTCRTSADCPMDGGPGLCVMDRCRHACSSAADCEPGTQCLLTRNPEGMRPRVCLETRIALGMPYGTECMGEMCAPPFSCIGGACVRACSDGADCGRDEVCAMAPGGLEACIPDCDICMSVANSTCRSVGMGPMACLPNAW